MRGGGGRPFESTGVAGGVPEWRLCKGLCCVMSVWDGNETRIAWGWAR